MSIVIKGVEMPKRCAECLMREPLSDYCELLLRYLDREELNGRDADCPLAELPEKHGRLVDADALIAKYGDWYTEEGTETGFIGTLEMLIKDAPTVVGAEGEGEEDKR